MSQNKKTQYGKDQIKAIVDHRGVNKDVQFQLRIIGNNRTSLKWVHRQDIKPQTFSSSLFKDYYHKTNQTDSWKAFLFALDDNTNHTPQYYIEMSTEFHFQAGDDDDEQCDKAIPAIAHLKKDVSVNEHQEYIDLHNDTNLMRSRYVRLAIFIIFIGLICTHVFGLNHGNTYHMIAYCMTITDGLWIITLITIISTSSHLHLIFTEIGRMRDIPFMYVSTGIRQYRHISIQSVSQISSLRGSSTYISGSSSAYITFSLGFTAICIKLKEINDDNNSYDDNVYYSLLILLVAHFGTIGAVLFPLDPSILTKFMHYLSAFAIIYGPTIAFCLCMQWDLLSIILISFQQIFVIIYGVSLFWLPHKSNDEKKVHLISLFSIFTELIAVTIAILSKILYVYNM